MPSNIPDTMEVLNSLIMLLRNLYKPILVSVHGAVAGIGMSFLMAADLAIAAESTQFTLAYANIGLTPDGGASYFLPRIVGQRRAMQLAMLPEKISAKEALSLGLLNWVVSDQDLEMKTKELIEKLSHGPTKAYGLMKRLINSDVSLEDHLQSEIHAFTECTMTQDFRHGVEGFLNKTPAIFEGK
jgi:2-(1,2-epoxy-1,2-dihydrophenyl)acetyl-CoA isomerase